MPTAYLTRTVRFHASHHYARPDWGAARNAAAFGEAAAPHDHDYACSVTVSGTVDPATGMVVDLAALDRVLKDEVVTRLDGRDLNALPEFGPGKALPTGEELCRGIWARVAPRLPKGCALVAVNVREDPTLGAEYRGES